MNTVKKTPNSQSIFLIGIFILIVLVIIAFMYYNSIKDYKVLLEEIVPLYNNYEKKISNEMIPKPDKLKMTFILWLYIDNNPENSQWFSSFSGDKIIMDKNGCPDIIYLPYKNTIKILINVKDIRPIIRDKEDEENPNSEIPSNIEFKIKKQEIEIQDIKFQKWNQLTVMIDNRYLDIYLNSVLVKSALLDNVPIFNQSDISLGRKKHNPNLFLGKIEYKPDILPLHELNALYLRDKDSFTLDNSIRNQVNMDTMKIRKDEYKNKILEDEIKKMNQNDPL